METAAKAAAKGPVATGGQFRFAGIADNYFAAVFLPEGNSSVQMLTFADTVQTPSRPDARALQRRGGRTAAAPTASRSSSDPKISTC